ncbi:MAG: C40 family peptidase [Clostridiales bacterium]|nr:C40 family peptidase [Clostridiales bacterium]
MSQKHRYSIVSWLLAVLIFCSAFQPALLAAESEAPEEAAIQEEQEDPVLEEEAPAGEEPEAPAESRETEAPSEPAQEEPAAEPYTGWQKLTDGKQYWVEDTPLYGVQMIGEDLYLFDEKTGYLLYGLQEDEEGHIYYCSEETGVLETEWQTIDGKKYYFHPGTGVAAVGIALIDKKQYAFDESGIQLTGWQTIESNVYYFDPSTGIMATGITTIDGKKYLLSANGVRLKGWNTIDGKKYYASAKGVLYSGQHKIGNYYYYFDKKTNAMVTNKFIELTNSKGKKYTLYFDKSGHKLFGNQTIGKYKYYFSKKVGAMAKSKFFTKTDKKGKKYKIYYDSKGRQAFGEKTIKGHIYYFNKKTGKLEWKDRKYQNPKGYYQIQSTDIKLKGAGYSLDIGSEGLKTRAVLKYLGISNGVGMYGSLYTSYVKERVKDFQRTHGLKVDGIVGIYTWKAMGFTKKQWLSLGGYASPNQGSIYNTKAELIEIMIDRAYDYLGDDYVIGASGAPGKGIDCSGLVMQALFAVGIDMTPINPVRHAHVDYEYESANIWKSPYLKHVQYSDRKRGDIVIYQNSSGTVIHSAIYLGNNKVIESWPNRVMVSDITASFHSNVKGILRVFN